MSRLIVETPKEFVNCGSVKMLLARNSNKRWLNFKPCLITDHAVKFTDNKMELEVFEDDIFVCTFPRSGTTLTQEMVWLIMNDFDFEGAKSEKLDNRSPELE